MNKKLRSLMITLLMIGSMFITMSLHEGPVAAIGQHEDADGTAVGWIIADTYGQSTSTLTLRPNAAGDVTQCSAVGDSPNYACVDEASSDGDSTYVRAYVPSGPSGETDIYNIPDCDISGEITSVSVYSVSKTESSGEEIGEILVYAKTHGETYHGGLTYLTDSYATYISTFNTNPNTGTDWNWEEINNLQIGFRLRLSYGGYARCTQSYVVVTYYDTDFTVTRDSESDYELNNFTFTTSNTFTTDVTLAVPVSTEIDGISYVENETDSGRATEVDTYGDLSLNTYYYDSSNNFVYIRIDDLSNPETETWEISCNKSINFYLDIPQYLEIGDYFMSRGLITDADDDPIDGVIAKTYLKYPNETTAYGPVAWHCAEGNYQCTFSTSTLTPNTYGVEIYFYHTATDTTYKEGSTLYLGVDPGEDVHVTAHLYFSFYNNETGLGLPAETFKLYVDDEYPLEDEDRIYHDTYKTYTGATLYYKVLDFFNNKIYPTNMDNQSVSITSVEQFENIPIDWYTLSVKNMNHSIVDFTITNSSKSIGGYLFPYEPMYFEVSQGDYNITMDYYNAETGAYEETKYVDTFSVTDDTYYWIVGYDLRDIIIEVTNTNSTIMDQIINIGVNINNDGADVINQALNLGVYFSNVETNITNQINYVWSSVNNTQTNIINQINSVWQGVNNSESNVLNQINTVKQSITNTETNITAQLNSVWQSVNNTETEVTDQANAIVQEINNFQTDINTQVNGVWQDINNTNSTIHSQLNTIISDVSNVNSNIDTQANYIQQSISNTEGNITTQVNAVWQNVNNSNSSIHTQLNGIVSEIQNANSTIHTQINTVQTTINNHDSNIETQINGVMAAITNTESNITNQITLVDTKITNCETNITTQINSVSTTVTNTETNITNQLNQVQVSISNTETNITNQINDIDIDITNSNTSIHNQLNTIITDISNTNATIVDQANTIINEISNTETTITTQLNGISSSISQFESNITSQVNIVITDLSNVNSSIHGQLNTISVEITNVETNLTSQINSVGVSITNTETNITTQLNDIESQITNVNVDIINQINMVWNAVNNTNGTIISNQINAISTKIDNTETNITNQINTISTEITNTETNITSQINVVSNQIINQNTNISDQFNTLQINLSNVNTSIHNQINSISTQITNHDSSIDSQLNTILTTITNTETDIINQVNLIWNEINNTNATIGVQINGISTKISTFWSNVNYSFTVIENNITYMNTTIVNLIDDMNATLLAHLTSVLDNVSEAGESVFDQVTDVLNNLATVNTSLHDELLEKSLDIIDNISVENYNTILNIVENISAVNSSLFDEIQAQALEIMANITDQADQNHQMIVNVSNAIGKLASGNLSTMIQNIYDNVTNIMTEVEALNLNISANLTVNLTAVLANLSAVLENLSMTEITIGDLINISFGNLSDIVFEVWADANTSFDTLEGRSVVVFNFYNTNQGLGLDMETLKILINGSRLMDNIYYCTNGTSINLTVKDYYNTTLYQNDFTITAPFTFIDLGLTFHSWLFGDKNDRYYMISLLKEGASRWWERGIVPYGEREFMIPSGNYTMRIYDANYDELYNDTHTVNRSMVYVIQGVNLTTIISGQSVIVGQLLELGGTLDDALMPDTVIYSRNPPIIFSVFDRIGSMLGNSYKICPPINVIAQTRVELDGDWINSTRRIPSNGTTENGTITLIEDIMYFSATGTPSYVNISYTNNGTSIQNTTYLPTRFYPNGYNITIRSDVEIHLEREIRFNQLKKFYWDYYPDTDNPGWLTEDNGKKRTGYHRTAIEIENTMNITWYDVYIYAGFTTESEPDTTAVRLRDVDNGNIVLEEGENYKVTGSGIEFKLTGSLPTSETRSFLAEYYCTYSNSYYYGSDVIHIDAHQTNIRHDEKLYNYFKYTWINTYDKTYRGSLSFYFDFPVETGIKQDDIIVYDANNQRNITDFVISDQFLTIGSNGVGDVSPGGGKTYEVYFKFKTYPGENVEDIHLDTPLANAGEMPISIMLIFVCIGLFLIFLGILLTVLDKTKKHREMGEGLAGLGLLIAVITWILTALGV